MENFWHNTEIHVPHLVRITISHYQFESIHPFLDGNSRIGRLLIPLYLISHKLLFKPSLYISDYLETHRLDYFDALTNVRRNNDLIQWIRFFLTAVIETAQKGIHTFQAILELRNNLEAEINLLGRRTENGYLLLHYLFKRPVIQSSLISQELEIAVSSANLLINEFEKLNILKEYTGFKRNKIFTFESYLAVHDLTDMPFESLVHTNEAIYDLITLGKSLEQTIDGYTRSFSLKYIRFLRYFVLGLWISAGAPCLFVKIRLATQTDQPS